VVCVVLLVVTVVLLALVLIGGLKAVLTLEWPRFINPIDRDSRDGYIALGLLAALSLGLCLISSGVLSSASYEAAGVKVRLNWLQKKIASHDQQIEELFRARRYEVFDARNWDHIRTMRKLPHGEGFEVEVTLQQEPVKESLEIFRGVLPVPPNNITGVYGNKVTLLTSPATYSGLPLVVEYYPLRPESR
jgi:hypothetical protein